MSSLRSAPSVRGAEYSAEIAQNLMSYKYEKNESGKYDIVISGWDEGIADTPLFGHGNMVNVDIFTNKGLVQAQYAAKKASGTNVTDLPKWFASDPVTGETFALDYSGKVYKQSTGWAQLTGNTLTGATGNGLAVFVSQYDPSKSFLFVTRNGFLDVYNIATATWTNGFKTLESIIGDHPVYLSSNQRVYIGNKNKVASFEERSGVLFDPSNAATYNWNDNALDLPSYYRITQLDQIGENLSIGTIVGAQGALAKNYADLFLWDRESVSFFRPVSFKTDGIKQILTIKNMIVVYAGSAADLFTTNGSYANEFIKFENIDFNNSGLVTNAYSGAIDSLTNSELLIGVSNIVAGLNPMGVYCIRDGKYVVRNLISTGKDGSLDIVQIGAVHTYDRNRYYIGWRSGNTYGIDAVNGDGERYEDWSARVETDLIPVNTNYFPTNLNEVEIRLADKMMTDQGVRISWRGSLNDSWSTPVTFDYATTGAVNTYALPIDIVDVKNVQLKIEILAKDSYSPKLWEVRLR